MTDRLLLVALSHRTAPIALRERLAIAGDELGLLPSDAVGARELVVLATCNRIELYLAVADADETRARILSELAGRAGVDAAALAAAATILTDDDVVRHLCRVAAGLDSALLGEAEILGQVRAAGASSGPLLDRLFACAVRAGRRVRNETALGEHPRSLAAVTVELAGSEHGALAGSRVLVVGAGALAKLVAGRFRVSGCELVVVGRAAERAAALAARVGGRAVAIDALGSELADADVLVSCTRSSGVVVTAPQVAAARAGVEKPLLVLDLALPRDLDPAVGGIAGCRLYDLAAVERRAATTGICSRRDEVAAETIASEEAARFCTWRRSRGAVTAIASLRSRAEAIRATELARARAKLAGLSPEQRDAVEALTAQIVNKLLHEPTVRVKRAADGSLVPALRDLFALEDAA